MKRSTMLIGCSVVAATLAATFQFASGLGGDAPVAGESAPMSTVVASTINAPSETTTATATTNPAVTVVTASPVTAPTLPVTTTASLPQIVDTTTTIPVTSTADDRVRDVEALLSGLVVDDPDPSRPPYDRDTYQPGGWADLDGDCISGRHEVLISLSEVPVRMTSSGCAVESGSWTDPYTGVVVTAASDITIDHVVPLSDADRAGAWRWDPTTKIAFANDETPGVLLAVVGSVNQSKGDKSPDEWLPPRQEFHCAYAANWVDTKARWQLSITRSESTALTEILSTCTSGDIPAPTADVPPPLIVLASPPVATTAPVLVQPVAGTGGGELQLLQCQKREERVTLVNPTADAVSLVGYQLHDEESRHATMLDGFGSIDAGSSLVVLTGEDAVGSPGEVIWKRQNVWNNDGDTAYLVTPAGTVTSTRC